MKEMQYGRLDGAITLDHNTYRGYEYLIINVGTHPAVYVNVPKDHIYYNQDFWNIKLKPHSDLSFGGTLERFNLKGFWIGWEYDLFGDYVYGRTREWIPEGWHHKYTTDELISKTYGTIDQLIEVEEISS